ncbi:peptide/nickel transport system permease protein [Curtobacterium sp. PhB25]|uniref:ABC transporter permease n=1 Tax=unclassified Curtobacterium TaxID=257496 RepID=UPI001051BC11|nr:MULTISPECIES: ABC transporter permease [unclassified Curtobacterium]TCU87672.1 peptide/nickel transport system permease protein [Curtobacterium sp. PhB191]TDW46235.1 peptide/nickel transport system permease protein [Curtobacterium sp. PhB42]TDW55641.1 peptide/nickel transport system permease protein [Curtobacterium sp. PhB190]TDW72848.1 peptide/nickel transport system permease protein [Curtobacterium sp. PhB25]
MTQATNRLRSRTQARSLTAGLVGAAPSLVVATVMLVIVALVVVVVPFLPGFNPYTQDLASAQQTPFTSGAHLMGTDALGRDLLSRLSVATRTSLVVAFGAVLISMVLGLAIGLVAGWRRGRLDAFLMGVADVQLSIPVVLLLIVLVAALGSSTTLLVVMLGLTNWVGYGRVSRSIAVSLREREFVTAVTAAGGSGWWVISRHLLPNVLPQIAILAAFEVGTVITIESSLSFLGLGIQPPTPSLGGLIADGQNYLQTNPALVVLPALMILMVIGGVQFVSQGLSARRSRR